MEQEIGFALDVPSDRSLVPALGRGWRRRCPHCGSGPMFDGYLKVRRSCAACGEALHHHRADDVPAWAVTLIAGHVVIASMAYLEIVFAPPVWVHWSIWPVFTLALVLWLLPRVKGSVVGFQWAQRMHGFGDPEHPAAGG